MCGKEPVSTKWLQNISKWFIIFKKLQNWKNLSSALVNIQALLTGGNMGEETGPRSKFSSIPRGGPNAAATSKMEHFVIIVNGFQPLTIITKRSILDVAAALDLPLITFYKLCLKITTCRINGVFLLRMRV